MKFFKKSALTIALLMNCAQFVTAGTLTYESVLETVVKDVDQLNAIKNLTGNEKRSVSMFISWLQLESNQDIIRASSAGSLTFLACDTGGFTFFLGYYGGNCSAFVIQKDDQNQVLVTAQLMRAKSLRGGADVGYVVGGSNKHFQNDIHNGSNLGVFKIRGNQSLNDIPGIYVKAASSAAVVVGGTMTWAMGKVTTQGLTGTYLDAQAQTGSFEVGGIFGEATLYRASSKPVSFAIQLN